MLSPRHGFDCSGLVQHVYREALGIELPRTSREMGTRGTKVARADLARDVNFPETTIGEDTGFLNECVRVGARIYSASRFGFVQRRGTTFGHTWGISNTEVLATSTISHWGPPHEMEMPTL